MIHFGINCLCFPSVQVDPKNLGSVGALDAANFLKKSGLPTAVLGKVYFCDLVVIFVTSFNMFLVLDRSGTCQILKGGVSWTKMGFLLH